MKDIIFLTVPKKFVNFDNTTFTIMGISAKLNNSHEIIIGSNNDIQVELKFWEKVNEEYIEKNVLQGKFKKAYTIPNIGEVKAMSGLFSPNKQEIYQVATLVAIKYGYQLLPFEEQTILNETNN